MAGLGLLSIDTVFSAQKTRARISGVFSGLAGALSGLNGHSFSGYDIHMGQRWPEGPVIRSGNVYGSRIHGLFDGAGAAEAVVSALYERRGLTFDPGASFDPGAYRGAGTTSWPGPSGRRWICI